MLKRHPLSALFAQYDLKGEELSSLAESIRDHGQQSPITLHEGMVLDGWNRHEACRVAGVEPVTIDLAPGQDPWEFVKGANMLRRHMTPADRVAVMLDKDPPVEMNGTPHVEVVVPHKSEEQQTRLCDILLALKKDVLEIRLEDGDPADLSQDDANALMREITGKKYR